jgi:hypothetical protein
MGDLTLFEIAREYRELANILMDCDVDEQTLLDTLEGESGALVEKGQNVAFVCRNLEANATAIKEAESKMAERRTALENRAKRLRKYLLDGMKLAGIKRIDSPYFTIKIAKNPVSVDIYEPGLVPKEYMTDPPPPPPAPDKKLIAQAIKDGFDVPGCTLKQGERVEIK